ncbi:hypothetical protein DUNSADRAFT_6643 [Dunaliella salina]|uniref:Uncharacterized protein n=1 Tax=Dunaliella salina TaxID=3046 RepID=A0ABQ7GMV4_DUNSA|nr:hypothetical protein DUNSADRAFT_6643 [Dunaliella salina]|eukprot:KAF5835932.1 hypothetical protein DUNSADRAFT_6643 [Dunaliella salina]
MLQLDGKTTAGRSGSYCCGSTFSSSSSSCCRSSVSGKQGNSSTNSCVPAGGGVGHKEVTNSTACTEEFGLHDNSTRVVMLSSLTHHAGILNWDDMQSEHKYDPFTSYALSKLANTITAVELQRRFEKASQSPDGCAWGNDSAVSAHPGIVNTSLATNFFKTQ